MTLNLQKYLLPAEVARADVPGSEGAAATTDSQGTGHGGGAGGVPPQCAPLISAPYPVCLMSVSESRKPSECFGPLETITCASGDARFPCSQQLCPVDRLCPVYVTTKGNSWCEPACCGGLGPRGERYSVGAFAHDVWGTPGLQCHKAATREALRPECGAQSAAPRPTVPRAASTVPRAASATVQLLRTLPSVSMGCKAVTLCASVPV